MASKTALAEQLQQQFSTVLTNVNVNGDCVTIDIPAASLLDVARQLKALAPFQFEQLIDVCGVDYAEYGKAQWRTFVTTASGFSRAAELIEREPQTELGATEPVVLSFAADHNSFQHRFAAVYHLLSITHNHRLRLRVYAEGEPPTVPSIVSIWSSANWFEREAYDLFGIVFDGHPDLRRLLTDYGFVGHPFRKDFPLIGKVEMRYDATLQRCVYEPVSIQARTTVARVIRNDNRYELQRAEEAKRALAAAADSADKK